MEPEICELTENLVFIGGAASISFLETVRQVVTTHIGPSPFSHNEGSGFMLETESPQARAKAVVSSEIAQNIEQLTADQTREYLQCYYDVVSLQANLSSTREDEASNNITCNRLKLWLIPSNHLSLRNF
jgi:hypothetical protein